MRNAKVAVSRPITADPDPAPEAALAAAHFPSLAAAVAQLTGDVGLLRNLQRPVHKVGDPTGGLPVPQIAEIRAAALAALGSHRERRAPPAPSPAAVREMMDFVAGTDIPKRYVPFRIPWDKITDIGVDVAVELQSTPLNAWRQRLREHILNHIPGA